MFFFQKAPLLRHPSAAHGRAAPLLRRYRQGKHTFPLRKKQKNILNLNVIFQDPRYAEAPSKDEFPMFESLKLTIGRTLPYWNDVIVPQIKEGKKVC